MKRQDRELDKQLDAVLGQIREEPLDAKVVDDAADRVWKRIEQECARRTRRTAQPIRDCGDFRALIPAFVTDSLNEARTLLLEDHIRECVPCRKAVKQARAGHSGASAVPRSAQRVLGREWTWAAAAAVLVAVALFGFRIDFLGVKVGGMVTIEEADGPVFRVTEDGMLPVSVGETFQLTPGEEALRTAKGTRAVVGLADGSQVEMKERTQLAVRERLSRLSGERTYSTVDLQRGGVIVDAADQGEGRLYVDTDALKVKVTGTVFSVNHGTKGSRVSVIEGQVVVDQPGQNRVLAPGGQFVSNPSVGHVPIADDIAWSRNLERHLALLNELSTVGREIDEIMTLPTLRHSTDLLDRAPADTILFAAIPNLSGRLGEAYDHLRTRVDANPVLSQWWSETVIPSGTDTELDEAFEKIRNYGEQFGPEIVVTLQEGTDGPDPLLFAKLTHPDQFRDLLLAELDQLAQRSGHTPNVVILEGPRPGAVYAPLADPEVEAFYLWMHDGYLAASPDPERIDWLANGAGAQGAGTFPGTEFHARLAERYRTGVEWIVGVDLGRIFDMEASTHPKDQPILERMGMMDVRHLIVQHRESSERSDTRALLSFDQNRRGVASWLAAPAPMGSLEFISPNASFAAAFVMKTPASLVDELFSMIGSTDDEFDERLAEFEREQGLDIRRDFAEPLGGEFAFALDGPMLPKPSWKLVMEVYDPKRLQHSLEQAVERLNQSLREHGKQGFAIDLQVGPRNFRSLRSLDTGISVYYTVVDGYLLAAPSTALLERALSQRSSRVNLVNSPRFTALMPQDGQLDFSAVAYQNLGAVLGPVARRLQSLATELGPDQVQMIEALGRNSSASLAFAYGRDDQIEVAASAEGGFFSSGLTLFSLQSMFDLEQSIQDTHGN